MAALVESHLSTISIYDAISKPCIIFFSHQFHLQQAKLRSKIRIDDGRAKPIDILGKYISTEDDDLAVEMHEPYTYLNVSKHLLKNISSNLLVYLLKFRSFYYDFFKDNWLFYQMHLSKLRSFYLDFLQNIL